MKVMNRHITDLIIQGKLIEKKHLNKNIIKKNLENVILHFKKYNQCGNSNILLKNILLYTKIVKLNSIYLTNFYENIISPFLKDKNSDVTLFPNIVHTYKQQTQFKYVLKEVRDIIIKRINSGNFFSHYNEFSNNWIPVLQEFSKHQDIQDQVQHILFFVLNQEVGQRKQIETKKKQNVSSMNKESFDEKNEIKNFKDQQIIHKFFTNKKDIIHFPIHFPWERLRLTPRSLSTVVCLLSKEKDKDKNRNKKLFNPLIEYICKQLPLFNNIDLCVIIHSLHNVKLINSYFAEKVNVEIFKRVKGSTDINVSVMDVSALDESVNGTSVNNTSVNNTSVDIEKKNVKDFDILQLSFLFRSLSNYWNQKQKGIIIILFLKKMQKYFNLYLLYKDYKYIFFTKNKNSLMEIISMFFLSFVKNSNSWFPLYFDFTKYIMSMLTCLHMGILVLKRNSFLKKVHLFQENSIKLLEQYNKCINNEVTICNLLPKISQFLCNMLYTYSGYLYKIMTMYVPTDGLINNHQLFWSHLHITMNNITQIFYFFMFFYNNRKYFQKNQDAFIIPLHKSQLMIFFSFYWDFLLHICFSIEDFFIQDHIKEYQTNIKQNIIKESQTNIEQNIIKEYQTNIENYFTNLKKIKKSFITTDNNLTDIFKHLATYCNYFSLICVDQSQLQLMFHLLEFSKYDPFYFVQLECLKNIYSILTIMDKIPMNPLMQKSIERWNENVSSVYAESIEIINTLKGKKRNDNLFTFKRIVEGPYTVTVLCNDNDINRDTSSFNCSCNNISSNNINSNNTSSNSTSNSSTKNIIIYNKKEKKGNDILSI